MPAQRGLHQPEAGATPMKLRLLCDLFWIRLVDLLASLGINME
jgi:hypothetical protein